ncbi:MAG: hypothetical protein Q8L48_10665 [Archangium sp.]|nr:hypothetical protein [Archangium sp.]
MAGGSRREGSATEAAHQRLSGVESLRNRYPLAALAALEIVLAQH